MELTIELQGQYQVESFQTILNEKTTLLTIAEMIQEAQYFDLTQVSYTVQRSRAKINLLVEDKHPLKHVQFKKELMPKCLPSIEDWKARKEVQIHSIIIVNKGEIIDQNIKVESNFNQINQQPAQLPEDIMKTQRNNNQQAGGGIVIGGGNTTASQYLLNMEKNIYQQNQKNNFDTANQVATIVQQNSIINPQLNQTGQAQNNLQQGTQFGKNQSQFNQQQSAQAVNQLNISEQQIKQPSNQQQPTNVLISNQGGYEIGGNLTQSEYYRQLHQNNVSSIERKSQQLNDSLFSRQSAQQQQQTNIKITEVQIDLQQPHQQLNNTNQINESLIARQQVQQSQYNNNQPSDDLFSRKQAQQSQYNNNQASNTLYSKQQAQQTSQINNQPADNLFSRQQPQQSQSINNQLVESHFLRQQPQQVQSTQQNSNQQGDLLFSRQLGQQLQQNNTQPVDSFVTRQSAQQSQYNNTQPVDSVVIRQSAQQVQQTNNQNVGITSVSQQPQIQPQKSIKTLYQISVYLNPVQKESLMQFMEEKQIYFSIIEK